MKFSLADWEEKWNDVSDSVVRFIVMGNSLSGNAFSYTNIRNASNMLRKIRLRLYARWNVSPCLAYSQHRTAVMTLISREFNAITITDCKLKRPENRNIQFKKRKFKSKRLFLNYSRVSVGTLSCISAIHPSEIFRQIHDQSSVDDGWICLVSFRIISAFFSIRIGISVESWMESGWMDFG